MSMTNPQVPYVGEIGVSRALLALPNKVVDAVEVKQTIISPVNQTFTVAMNSSLLTGNQNLVEVNVEGCDLDGCQPRFPGAKR